jgi:hypothetical protein
MISDGREHHQNPLATMNQADVPEAFDGCADLIGRGERLRSVTPCLRRCSASLYFLRLRLIDLRHLGERRVVRSQQFVQLGMDGLGYLDVPSAE